MLQKYGNIRKTFNVRGYTKEKADITWVYIPNTPILALIGDMGWPTSQIKRHRNMIRYCNRLINVNDNRITKQVFIYDISKCNSNWSSKVTNILNAIDHKSVFDNHTTCNYNNVYDKCVSNFNERWKLGLTLKPILRTYIKFKEQFETEQHIKYCVSCHKRSLLAQFRMGVLPLAIETGRFKSIPVE